MWLNNFKRIQHKLIKADIPWENPDLAFLVYKLQQSDKSALAYSDNPTTFVNVNGKDILQLYHPQEAFALDLQGEDRKKWPPMKIGFLDYNCVKRAENVEKFINRTVQLPNMTEGLTLLNLKCNFHYTNR